MMSSVGLLKFAVKCLDILAWYAYVCVSLLWQYVQMY